LLNGLGGNIEMWEGLAACLTGRHLIMIDMPGTGGSPALRTPLRMSGYAKLVVGALDQLGVELTDVLGYSWGGALAQQLARTAPTRVRSLVLAATIPGLGGQPPPPWVLALLATPARYYSRTCLRLIAPIVFGSDPATADAATGEARRRRPPSLVGYSQQVYAITGWSSMRWLHRLNVPVLVLSGARDPLAPLCNGRILARAIPRAQLRIVGGGHLFLFEQPEEGCQAMSSFLMDRDQADEALDGLRGPPSQPIDRELAFSAADVAPGPGAPIRPPSPEAASAVNSSVGPRGRHGQRNHVHRPRP
jgi:pimeloyl-ACP methyl ester carboxylesterase